MALRLMDVVVGGGSSSVAYLNIRFHTRYAAVCSYFISLMSAVLDKFM